MDERQFLLILQDLGIALVWVIVCCIVRYCARKKDVEQYQHKDQPQPQNEVIACKTFLLLSAIFAFGAALLKLINSDSYILFSLIGAALTFAKSFTFVASFDKPKDE